MEITNQPTSPRVGPLQPLRYTARHGDTKFRGGSPPHSGTPLGRLEYAEPDRDLDAQSAMEAAIYQLLAPMEMYSSSLSGRVSGTPSAAERFTLKQVFLGPPSMSAEQMPVPSAAILPDGKCEYEPMGRRSKLLEDTIDVFGEGTVLRRTGNASQTFSVHFLAANHDDRRAIRAAIERTFLVEPDDDQVGRKVEVAVNYNRIARIEFRDALDGDSPPSEQSNKCDVIAIMDVATEVVKLMRRPVDTHEAHVNQTTE